MDVFDQKVTSLLEGLLEKCEELYPDVHFEEIQWKDQVRGRVAGKAFYKIDTLDLNRELPLGVLEEVITHEFCHLVAWKKYKETGHKKRWKEIMRAFGHDPKRCHDIDLLPVRQERRWPYVCKGCGRHFSISTRRHNKMQHKDYAGTCLRCRTVIDKDSYVPEAGERLKGKLFVDDVCVGEVV